MADSTTTLFINLHQTDEKYIHWPLTRNPIILLLLQFTHSREQHMVNNHSTKVVPIDKVLYWENIMPLRRWIRLLQLPGRQAVGLPAGVGHGPSLPAECSLSKSLHNFGKHSRTNTVEVLILDVDED